MPEFSLTLLVTVADQLLGATILAAILGYLCRKYRRSHLRYWSASWAALACLLLVRAGTIWLLWLSERDPVADRRINTGGWCLALSFGYLQAVWLLLGTYEVTTRRTVSRFPVTGTFLTAVGVAGALGLIIATDP